MSRTYRNYGPYVNPEDWFKPWQAKGDHPKKGWNMTNPKAFKTLCKRNHRAKERELLRISNYSNDFNDDIIINKYKRHANPWDFN